MAKFKTKDVRIEAYMVGELIMMLQYDFNLLPSAIKKEFAEGKLYISIGTMSFIREHEQGHLQSDVSITDYVIIKDGEVITVPNKEFHAFFVESEE